MFCKLLILMVVVSVSGESTSCAGFLFNGKCFFAKAFPVRNVDYARAKNLCSDHEGHPANIYDRGHYEKVLEYLRSKASPSIQLWLGMTYDRQENKVRMSGGNVSQFVDWRPIYPIRNERFNDWTQMVIHAKKSPSFSEGMGNLAPSILLTGVLCESI